MDPPTSRRGPRGSRVRRPRAIGICPFREGVSPQQDLRRHRLPRDGIELQEDPGRDDDHLCRSEPRRARRHNPCAPRNGDRQLQHRERVRDAVLAGSVCLRQRHGLTAQAPSRCGRHPRRRRRLALGRGGLVEAPSSPPPRRLRGSAGQAADQAACPRGAELVPDRRPSNRAEAYRAVATRVPDRLTIRRGTLATVQP